MTALFFAVFVSGGAASRSATSGRWLSPTVLDPQGGGGATVAVTPGGVAVAACLLIRSLNDDLFLVTPTGTPIRQLTSTPTEGEGGASWSPNGKKIVFSRWNATVTKVDLYTMNHDGTSVTQLTNDNVSDWSPDWTGGPGLKK